MAFKEKFPIVSRNISNLIKERTFVLLLLLLFFIIISMGVLISVVVFLFNPQFLVTESIPVGILENQEVLPDILRIQSFEFISFLTLDDAILAFENATIDAIIYEIDQEASPRILELIVVSDSLKQSLILSLLKRPLERAESRLHFASGSLENVIHDVQIRFSTTPLSGTNTIYEAILGLMIPLLLLIPIFLIGNLFVDSVSQEFEEGNMDIILSTISPLRYIYEHVLQAVILNSLLSALFIFFITLRFPYIENQFLLFVYAQLFLLPIILLSLGISFIFKKKDVSQLLYSFIILALFVISPFLTVGPTYIITDLLLGSLTYFFLGVVFIIATTAVLYTILRFMLSKEYYL